MQKLNRCILIYMRKILTSKFFVSNREKLKNLLGDGPPIAIVAHGYMQRSNDTEYPFEQDRNFYYLTGLDEPDWILILDTDNDYLIAPEISETEKIFNGEPDLDIISKETGIKRVLHADEGWKKLDKLSQVRTILPPEAKINSIFTNPSKRAFVNRLGAETQDVTAELLHLRTLKTTDEIKAIRRAIDITADGFNEALKKINELDTEAEIEAIFTSHFTAKESRHGYTPIVAGGKNACTLHYTANNHKLPENGLVLIDIGAQYQYYSADVTRTLTRGDLSERQLGIRDVVKDSFDKIFKIIEPGLKLDAYQKQANAIMSAAISDLGLGEESSAVAKHFPHAPSHGLGLDVHDSLVGFDDFQPGMVITLEPGIYIPDEGIGIRYEDDILITETGAENISSKIGQ